MDIFKALKEGRKPKPGPADSDVTRFFLSVAECWFDQMDVGAGGDAEDGAGAGGASAAAGGHNANLGGGFGGGLGGGFGGGSGGMTSQAPPMAMPAAPAEGQPS